MKKNNFGFSLIELLVVISIIGILAMSLSSFNFNKFIDKEYINEFRNQAYVILEKSRNDSLLGKSISGSSLIIPEKKIISLSTTSITNSGSMEMKNYSGSSLLSGFDEKLNIDKYYSISNLKCGSNTLTKMDIIITGGNIVLSGGTCNTNTATGEIELKYKSFTGTIKINTISNLIEKG